MLARREEISAYQNQAVVRRFQKEHPEHAENAQGIFDDLMLFFWASKKHESERLANPANAELDFVFIMDEEMKLIDVMWHKFLLYTQDYMDFCGKYFGEYLHHLPDVVPNRGIKPIHFETNLERFLNYVCHELGPEVVRRWFAESLKQKGK